MKKAKTKAKRKAPIKLTKSRPPKKLSELQRDEAAKRNAKAIKKGWGKLPGSEIEKAEQIAELKKMAEPPKTEISVRSVYHDGQFLPALCFRSVDKKIVPCLAGDRMGINLFEIDVISHDKSALVMHGPESLRVPYSTDRFLAFMNKLVADGAAISTDALAAMQRALYPFPVARPHAVPARYPHDASGPATDARPDPVNAPGKPVRSAATHTGPQRTDGKELIRELSRVSGLPPEKVRAKLRASGLRAPYVDPVACREAMKVPDEVKKPRKKK